MHERANVDAVDDEVGGGGAAVPGVPEGAMEVLGGPHGARVDGALDEVVAFARVRGARRCIEILM